MYTYAEDLPALRITGVYFPPSAKPSIGDVAMLTDIGSVMRYKKEVVGHLIGGDLNRPSWLSTYEEWAGEYGMVELTNPALGTFASGNSLDKFLFLPGSGIPPSFLMEEVEVEGQEGEADTEFYPGETGEAEVAGNRHPIFLTLPYGTERPPPYVRRLAIGDLSDEKWERRNETVAAKLEPQMSAMRTWARENNIQRLYDGINLAIPATMNDLFTRKPRDREKTPELKDPFTVFCKKNHRHPKVTELKIVRASGNHPEEERLIKKIQRDGWQRYLATMSPGNTTSLYRLLRKKDGRESKTFTYPCAAPLLHQETYIARAKGKCELLADHFYEKFSNPKQRPARSTNQQEEEEVEAEEDEGENILRNREEKEDREKPEGIGARGSGSGHAISPVAWTLDTPFAPFREVEILKPLRKGKLQDQMPYRERSTRDSQKDCRRSPCWQQRS